MRHCADQPRTPDRTHMATLLDILEDQVNVEYNSFYLQEIPELRISGMLDVPPTEAVVGGPGGLHLRSGGTDHQVDVRVELWATEPEQTDHQWTHHATVALQAAGALRVQTVGIMFSGRELALPDSTDHFLARVFSQGRERAEQLAEATFATGVEKWLIQLWPQAD